MFVVCLLTDTNRREACHGEGRKLPLKEFSTVDLVLFLRASRHMWKHSHITLSHRREDGTVILTTSTKPRNAERVNCVKVTSVCTKPSRREV